MCIRFINKKPKLQGKEVTITENGTTNITADTGYDGLSEVDITTNVSTSEYNVKVNTVFNDTKNTLSKNIVEIPLIDTSSVTNMSNMFQRCTSLTSVPSIDTSSATNMSNMFNECSTLTSIPLLNTSRATNMNNMFSGCTSLTSIPLIDTSSATNMSNMFQECSALTSIPLIDTSHATMGYMFQGCSALTSIPLLNTSSVTNMRNTFDGCTSLSNESLNNILAMCTNATKITSNKTLKYIGLTSAQATTCQGLSNWDAFVSAGWTTGY